MNNFDQHRYAEMLDRSTSIVVTSHHNPDGDAIGSVLALALLLEKLGKDVQAMVPNDYPDFLKWMPGNEKIAVYARDTDACKQAIDQADMIFCLDYNALHRTGEMQEPLKNARGIKVLIDHHLEPAWDDFDIHYSTTETSSTGELLYRFIRQTGFSHKVDADIATALFVGIMTDTGSFSYSCNYPETFEITAELIRTGINTDAIHKKVYDTYSLNRLRLLGYCLEEKLTVLPEFQTAYIALSRDELQRFNHQVGDTEGIVNYALSVENIKVAVLMTERDDRIRLSFRSKGDFSVNRMAREHFNGGGHLNAAGGDSFTTLDKTIEKLLRILPQYREEIFRSKF